MCTIGNVFLKSGNASFKQCDLKPKTEFLPPQIVKGEGPIEYLPFRRIRDDASTPCWAGINNFGISFVAADAYTNEEYSIDDEWVKKLFIHYEKTIASCRNATDAGNIMESFYRSGFPAPDIIHITDTSKAIFMEYSPNKGDLIGRVERENGFFASTNHFRILADAIKFEKNHSTYLRLARTEAILQSDPSLRGIFSVLSDRYFGDTDLSVCRIRSKKNQFYTQASVIFIIQNECIDCAYIVNGNPKENAFSIWHDIFNPRSRPDCIKSSEEFNSLFSRYND
jgi:hypothetical protein